MIYGLNVIARYVMLTCIAHIVKLGPLISGLKANHIDELTEQCKSKQERKALFKSFSIFFSFSIQHKHPISISLF